VLLIVQGHGGHDRAIMIYARSNYNALKEHLGTDIEALQAPGLSENIEVASFDERMVLMSARCVVGEALSITVIDHSAFEPNQCN
jgi:MOSC domain-containing protein YiiM